MRVERRMAIDGIAIEAGSVLVQRIAGAWAGQRDARAARDRDLVELVTLRVGDQIVARGLAAKLNDVAMAVADRLRHQCRHEYRGLADNDAEAALAEVVTTLRRADLGDLDPYRLTRQIRSGAPPRDLAAELGEAAARFHDLLLEQCCACLVRIVRELPEFAPRAQVETLNRLSQLQEQVAGLSERVTAACRRSPSTAT